MKDRYDIATAMYDRVLKSVVPRLSAETLDQAVEAVNSLVRLQRPVTWAMSDEPRVILGITSDQTVAYGEIGTLGFYHAVPYEGLHDRLERMVASARRRYKQMPSPGPAHIPNPSRISLENRQQLLRSLERLRKTKKRV